MLEKLILETLRAVSNGCASSKTNTAVVVRCEHPNHSTVPLPPGFFPRTRLHTRWRQGLRARRTHPNRTRKRRACGSKDAVAQARGHCSHAVLEVQGRALIGSFFCLEGGGRCALRCVMLQAGGDFQVLRVLPLAGTRSIRTRSAPQVKKTPETADYGTPCRKAYKKPATGMRDRVVRPPFATQDLLEKPVLETLHFFKKQKRRLSGAETTRCRGAGAPASQ